MVGLNCQSSKIPLATLNGNGRVYLNINIYNTPEITSFAAIEAFYVFIQEGANEYLV